MLDPMSRSLKHFKVSIITVLKTFSKHSLTRELVGRGAKGQSLPLMIVK